MDPAREEDRLIALSQVAVLGALSYRLLPIDAVPDITNVQVQINSEAEGYSPLEAEQRVNPEVKGERGAHRKFVEFRDRILNHTYQGVKQFVDSNGLTNEQIYEKLLDGKETLLPVIDNQMDLQLELYANYSTSTVGYTYANTTKIWMNRKFFDVYDPEEVARNVFHEWTHKLGFGHDSSATSRRPYSVPYAIGKIIQDLAYKL